MQGRFPIENFKNKWFSRFVRQQDINDAELCQAVERAERGLIDADLGAGVIKQRIARPGQGRSGGFRSIILLQSGERAFFVYGFPKSNRDNIGADEEKGFKELAQHLFAFTDKELQTAIEKGILIEVVFNPGDM